MKREFAGQIRGRKCTIVNSVRKCDAAEDPFHFFYLSAIAMSIFKEACYFQCNNVYPNLAYWSTDKSVLRTARIHGYLHLLILPQGRNVWTDNCCIYKFRGTYFAAFKIPPDFDDTFVNIGLVSLLVRDGRFPAAVAQWKQQNTNLTSVFVKLKRYAYR